jgi:diadenylate cyclase
MIDYFLKLFSSLTTVDVLITIFEIFFFTFLFYQILILIKGTKGESIGKGLIIIFLALPLTKYLRLYTINWVLEKVFTVIFIAIPIVFQPEIRKVLEKLGKSNLKILDSSYLEKEEISKLISDINKSAFQLSEQKIGAIFVLEREASTLDFVEGGIEIGAPVSRELINSIFYPHNPLHDGAIIIRGSKIIKARCFLPFTENPNLSPVLGSRHRAAIGISEVTDAIAIVVSEETGNVSLAREGKLEKVNDEKALEEVLKILFQQKGKRTKIKKSK